jgi:hypothetical protein
MLLGASPSAYRWYISLAMAACSDATTISATIDNPTISTYVVENLAPGTYAFVATAFNAAGVESAELAAYDSNKKWFSIKSVAIFRQLLFRLRSAMLDATGLSTSNKGSVLTFIF